MSWSGGKNIHDLRAANFSAGRRRQRPRAPGKNKKQKEEETTRHAPDKDEEEHLLRPNLGTLLPSSGSANTDDGLSQVEVLPRDNPVTP